MCVCVCVCVCDMLPVSLFLRDKISWPDEITNYKNFMWCLVEA